MAFTENIGILLMITVAFVAGILIRLVIVLQQLKTNRRKRLKTIQKSSRKSNVKTLVVLGSGGHTTEMLHLLSSLRSQNYAPLDYIVASSDSTSEKRLEAFQKNHSSSKVSTRTQSLPPHNHIYKIPRSREVGQSYASSIFTTLNSIIYTAHLILFQSKPDLLLINGPGTCLPVALWTFVSRFLGLSEGNIVFIESFCRVKTLSLTGKILWKLGIVDIFLVHWPELIETKDGETIRKHQGMILLDSFIHHDKS